MKTKQDIPESERGRGRIILIGALAALSIIAAAAWVFA